MSYAATILAHTHDSHIRSAADMMMPLDLLLL
jgi:hypothetical protein